MKLFYNPGACSLTPHIVLHECGLDFTAVKVDLASKTTERGEDYRQINAKGKVPALELDDGSVLTEAVAIIQYLADLKTDRQLLAPAGSLTRYHTIEWLNFIATELHKAFYPLFDSAAPEAYKATLRTTLEQKLSWVNGELEEKQWLMGLRFSVADAYLYNMVRWATALKLNLSGLDALNSWAARVAERPAVSAALKAEGLI
ncbi:glutathione transferase GstA [Erwiniaceae bacterium BAC15a-03b]|uniref:Glutathione transferase GstA n=1 Tax=Winslowiella arboricola TaxID=2978220 RepID=A0A9J6Q0R7_9GAMM|nr:glutathione transferase GstA [Winslowiella arboricola]MCU5772274.1 glutathione transferase GstA [Winslowiella arboricola]MCU5779847.1 glutathione transferase GstA [Winslowiella arboricola]